MPNFKVINPDTPEEIDLVQDIPLVDEETGSDQIDSEGNILVKRYVTRTVNLNGINAVKDSLPQINENTKNLKELHDYSHSVNTDQQDQILENSSKITELLTDTTALEVTVTEIESKLKGIQGIDIDEVKSDLDALQQSAYLITGGILKGDISIQTPNTATVTLNPSGSESSASFSCTNDMLECTSTWGKLFKQSEEGGFFYGLSSTALADKNGKELTNYIADIMGSNAQLTFIKGDGTSQVISINNVISATKATQDGNGKVISDTYLPLSGGAVAGNVTIEDKNIVRSVNGVQADANGNVDIIVFDATTEAKGIVQLCDDIEQNTTNRTMAVTPHAVAAYVSAGGKKANDIGIVGRQGFGVSFPDATEDELATIGMSPMNGTYDKTSDNYGNFMSDNGGVFVYIPHHYIRYGEQTEADYDVYGANVLSVKSHDAYNSEAEANADGFFSPRAFYDGSDSVNQQGFFMQKYEPYAKTVGGVIYPYGDGSARGMVNITSVDMMTRARNLGSDYFVASYFMHQAMDTITLLQGQHSTGTANCAWWKSRGGANYPNNGWSTTNPQLYSHNGQKNGIMGVSNFTWEFCLGVTTSGTSATQGQTTVANNKIYLLKPTVKIKDLTNGFGGSKDAWGTTANLLENYDEFDTTDHFVLTTSRTWYWGNGNNQMYISPVKNGVLDTKARDSFMLIPNSEQSISSSANTMMGACLSYTNPCTQNLALYVHGENIYTAGGQNVFSRGFVTWRPGSHSNHSFRCGTYLRD